jgi:hypothetical protein
VAYKHRTKANSRSDKKSFSRNAVKQHVKNIPVNPMRGGFRL